VSSLLALLVVVLVVVALIVIIQRRRRRRPPPLPPTQTLYQHAIYQDTRATPGILLSARSIPLRGKPDILIREGHTIIPLELKTGRTPTTPYPGHVLQVLAYCLLVDEHYHVRPTHGIIRYRARDVMVPYTAEEEQRVRALVREMLDAKRGGIEQHRSHRQPRRCAACGFRDRCLEALPSHLSQ
jgi:CRISPR-associated exonuclease Cas4